MTDEPALSCTLNLTVSQIKQMINALTNERNRYLKYSTDSINPPNLQRLFKIDSMILDSVISQLPTIDYPVVSGEKLK